MRAMAPLKTTEDMRPLRRWIAFATSLRGQLWLLWLFIVLLSAFMTVIIVGLYQSGSTAQIDAARRITRSTCQSIRSLYAANSVQAGSRPEPNGAILSVLVGHALSDTAGVEGGVWERERGFVAYAFLTHEGATTKVDVPAAETPWIIEQTEKALSRTEVAEEVRRGTRDALILVACPLAAEPRTENCA